MYILLYNNVYFVLCQASQSHEGFRAKKKMPYTMNIPKNKKIKCESLSTRYTPGRFIRHLKQYLKVIDLHICFFQYCVQNFDNQTIEYLSDNKR